MGISTKSLLNNAKGFTSTGTPATPSPVDFRSLGDSYLDTDDKTVFYRGNGQWIDAPTIGAQRGYVCGGNTISTIQRFQFANDGVFSTIGSLTTGTYRGGGSNSSMAAYLCCTNTFGSVLTSNIDRILFDNDGSSKVVGKLPYAPQSQGQANFNSSLHGFSTDKSSNVGPASTVARYSFSLDAGDCVRTGILSIEGYFTDLACNSSTSGFVGVASYLDRCDFAFDIGKSSIRSGYFPHPYVQQLTGCNSSINGYSVGGYFNTVLYVSTIYKFPFTITGGQVTAATVLSTGNNGLSACMNSTQYGYTAGSAESGGSSVNRFQFAMDNASTVVSAKQAHSTIGQTGIDGVDFVTQFLS